MDYDEGNDLHGALEHDPLSEEYWDNLFGPLRDFLIHKLRGNCPTGLSYDEIPDVADEIILRIYKYFDFSSLPQATPQQRRMRFHAFIKRVIESVMSETLRQKGLLQETREAPIPGSALGKRIPADLIWDAFDTLSPSDQQILQYKVIDRLPYEEIQLRYKQHGISLSVDALKVRASRAVRRLRVTVGAMCQHVPGGANPTAKAEEGEGEGEKPR